MKANEATVGQLGIRYLIDGAATETLGVFELTVPPGSNVPPPHSHSSFSHLRCHARLNRTAHRGDAYQGDSDATWCLLHQPCSQGH